MELFPRICPCQSSPWSTSGSGIPLKVRKTYDPLLVSRQVLLLYAAVSVNGFGMKTVDSSSRSTWRKSAPMCGAHNLTRALSCTVKYQSEQISTAVSRTNFPRSIFSDKWGGGATNDAQAGEEGRAEQLPPDGEYLSVVRAYHTSPSMLWLVPPLHSSLYFLHLSLPSKNCGSSFRRIGQPTPTTHPSADDR